MQQYCSECAWQTRADEFKPHHRCLVLSCFIITIFLELFQRMNEDRKCMSKRSQSNCAVWPPRAFSAFALFHLFLRYVFRCKSNGQGDQSFRRVIKCNPYVLHCSHHGSHSRIGAVHKGQVKTVGFTINVTSMWGSFLNKWTADRDAVKTKNEL